MTNGSAADGRMSDQNERDAGTKSRLSLRPAGGRLELGRTVDAGSVRQSFSHGRSKVVQVEVRKTRAPTGRPGGTAPAGPAPSGGGGGQSQRSSGGSRQGVSSGRALTASEIA